MGELPWLENWDHRTTDELIAFEGVYRIDSIVCAFEQALGGKANHTEAERVVLAVEAVEREVNNGGFSQLFCNSSCEYANSAAAALRAIGAPLTADLYERALQEVGGGKSASVEELQLRALGACGELDSKLSAIDAEYYAGLDEPIAEKLFDYIKRRRSDIRLSAF